MLTAAASGAPDATFSAAAAVAAAAVGDVPLVWYKDEDHIGYDIEVRPPQHARDVTNLTLL